MTATLSFKNSGLPQDRNVKKAYALTCDIPRAVGSARILAEMLEGDPLAVTAHLLAFVEPRIDLADIKQGYGYDASSMVEYIRRYHDEGTDIFKLGCSIATDASFIACALWDAEQQLSACKGHALSTAFMNVSTTAQGEVIRRTSVENLLRDARRNIEQPHLVLAQMSGFQTIVDRVRQTLRNLDVMIATAPEEPVALAKKAGVKAAPKR